MRLIPPLLASLVALLALAGCGRDAAAPETADPDAPRPIAATEAAHVPDEAEPAAVAPSGAETVAGTVTAAARAPFVLVMIGDSLTGGHELPPDLALPSQLAPLLAHAGLHVDVRNAGVANDTTALARARFDAAAPAGTDGVVLELGAVDMLAGAPPTEIRANLAALVEAAQTRGLWVGLVGMRAPLTTDPAYQDAFNALYADVADAYDVPLYPFYFDGLIDPETGDSRPELFQADGVHPTDVGVALVAEGIADWLEDELPDAAKANGTH